MKKSFLLAIVIANIALLNGCGKKPVTETAPPIATPPPQAAAPAPVEPVAPAEDPELIAKKQAIEFALAEQKIADETNGQWAASAKASSTYNQAKDQASYSEWQATGAPNVERYGDNGNSWTSKDADAGVEWLQVGFAKPVHASEIRIRQNNAPGAIIKVELIDEKNNSHTVFEGMDANKYPPHAIVWFTQATAKTDYVVTGAKITLATNAVYGWNEIDAVQLVGE
jgi:predicted small lipoprotein YifL